MDIPTSSLHNQHIQKKSHFRFGFGFLFIASVGLNVFLLFFDQESNVSVAYLPSALNLASGKNIPASRTTSALKDSRSS